MFVCDDCCENVLRALPRSFKSLGRCKICGSEASCSDIPYSRGNGIWTTLIDPDGTERKVPIVPDKEPSIERQVLDYTADRFGMPRLNARIDFALANSI